MTIRAIAGLVVFNLTVLGVGAAILWGLGALRWWTELVRLAGVAYLLGLGSLMILLTFELVLGVPITLVTSAVSLVGLAAAGLALGLRLGHARPPLRPPEWYFPRISLFAAASLAGLVVYFEGLFRAARLSSILGEWDGWWFWVPKAKAIYFFGRLEPELLAFFPDPSPSYPPGLPAVHAVAFHGMGSADDTTLHVQYWFYAVGFTAALVGLLGPRVRQNILAPLVLLIVLAPSFVARLTWTYADLPLGYLVAVAALLIILWVEERRTWQLVAATILLSGAMLTKREGILFAACVLFAAFATSWREWRAVWPRLAIGGLVAFALALPWRIWFMAHGLPSDAPSAGYLGAFTYVERAWPSLELAVTTLFESELWLIAPVLVAVAIVLASLADAWVISIYAAVFAGAAIAAATWTIWSNPSLPFTQDDAVNPIVRMTGTTILVLAALTPLLLERAWSGRGERRVPSRVARAGPDAFVSRSLAAWAMVLVVALAYPAAMVVGYSGQTLPGGLPRFPGTSDCVAAPIPGQRVRFVVGYADSYPEAHALRERAVAAGLRAPEVSQDGCGRLRVFVDDLPTVAAGNALIAPARSVGLEPTLESDSGG